MKEIEEAIALLNQAQQKLQEREGGDTVEVYKGLYDAFIQLYNAVNDLPLETLTKHPRLDRVRLYGWYMLAEANAPGHRMEQTFQETLESSDYYTMHPEQRPEQRPQ